MLHCGEYSSTLQCVQRTLDQLVANGKLMEKVYGKQKVYVIDQVYNACTSTYGMLEYNIHFVGM